MLEIRLLSVVSRDGDDEVALTFSLTDGERRERKTLRMLLLHYQDMSLVKGPITREEYEAVEEADALCRAIAKASSLLGYGANSSRTLAYKLRRKGFSAEVAERAVKHLTDSGLVNEGADVAALIEQSAAKLWGRARILSHLYAKGYDREAIEEATEVLESIDFIESCVKLIRKQGGVATDPEESARQIASLARYGYSLSEIKEAMRLSRR